jgi:hypothetical protein
VATAWADLRKWLARATLLGLVSVALSVAMMHWALARGVHCLGCDYLQIHGGLAWWQAFWDLKDFFLSMGAGIGVVAVLLGKPRWHAVPLLLGAGYASIFLQYK